MTVLEFKKKKIRTADTALMEQARKPTRKQKKENALKIAMFREWKAKQEIAFNAYCEIIIEEEDMEAIRILIEEHRDE